jgi:hypothetical protein
MNITTFFKRLGAPLKSQRWSWGGVAPDGNVFLRVWQGETTKVDGKNYVLLTNRARFEGTKNLGYEERLSHIRMLEGGARGYCIFCEPKDPEGVPRELKSYVDTHLFPAGELIEHQGDIWLEFGPRVPVEPFLRASA